MTTTSATTRQNAILERLRRGEECHVTSLAEAFGVSEMTVRRDLDALAAQGQIVRTHGGAAPASGVVFHFKFLDRASERRAAKKAIASRAAELVPDGSTVALDSGTTTLALAGELRCKHGVTVITTSLPVASELQHSDSIMVLLLGGRVRRESPDLSGALTLRSLEVLHVDVAFFGTDAIDLQGTCYQGSIEVAHLQGAMAALADAVYVVADSSKLDSTATARVGSLAAWDGLITDRDLGAAAQRKLKAAGVNVIKARRT